MAIKTMVGFEGIPFKAFEVKDIFIPNSSNPPISPIFSGKKLFELKATHGLPLDVAISRIADESASIRIDWVEFIETARSNGWWDYQTVEAIEIALTDADLLRSYRDEVLQRVKLYMLTNPIDISTALVSKE